MLLLTAVTAVFYSFNVAVALSPPVPRVSIPTTSGQVSGTQGINAPEVAAYLGIPFALPPIGLRRFLPPQRLNAPDQVIEATKHGADCPGTVEIGQGLPPNEDCLTLSIWVPPKTEEPLKAVMIWIYGGAFEGGSSAVGLTDGSLLAKKGDVIVVAVNCRLSILGFPGAKGLQDQNLRRSS